MLTLHGIGPSGAARLLIDVGEITRFPTKGHFASWNGTAPVGSLLRRPDPPPALPRRQPADQPDAAHHGDRPAAQPDRRPCLLGPEEGIGQDVERSHPLPEATTVRHRLPAHGRRRHARNGVTPKRERGDVLDRQRRASVGCAGDVLGEQVGEGVPTERPAEPGAEDPVGGGRVLFGCPVLEQRGDWLVSLPTPTPR
jgi:hypothetical protein